MMKSNLIIELILKCPTLHSVIKDFIKGIRIFDHSITDVGIQGILSIRVCHDIDEATYDHRKVYSWRVVFSN